MNKTPTKQYFEEVLANQQEGYSKFIRLMPNNINTCKLIEQTLEDNGYRYIINSPSWKEQDRDKYITNRNNRTKLIYVIVWSDYMFNYNNIHATLINNEYFAQGWSCTYVTSRNVKEATLQVIEALKQYKENNTCEN